MTSTTTDERVTHLDQPIMDAAESKPPHADDRMTAASQALTRALSDAQEAIDDARAEKSQAIAALEEIRSKFSSLQDEMQELRELRDLTARQRQEIETLRAQSTELDVKLTSEHGRMYLKTIECSLAQAFLKAHEASIQKLTARKQALKEENARLTDQKNNLIEERGYARTALARLKRTVEDVELWCGEDEEGDHEQESEDAPPARKRKRAVKAGESDENEDDDPKDDDYMPSRRRTRTSRS
ncbi:hypothetical protein C8R45DRAFT_1223040 [Mycena sanguinolenta]|nr:hypothetical protein C8R45DRAFT_1223040 [Mycena sanguinolenta]